ncbi:VWA domain-containing protein [Bifidobacterium sp. CP2]|uniref:vWA domain-containing protein n=1 Tax=Bifidobacterium sp. CP2 TaxID=2809025 RepID=UPI001BDD875F|nr:vWA domain-containing protein [Bifidobacterium sp. CP2]MBT1181665.1 VWA domain-containing protein [Bifidobacterium sp. CP2]
MRKFADWLAALGEAAQRNGKRITAVVAAAAMLTGVVGVTASAMAATAADGTKNTTSAKASKAAAKRAALAEAKADEAKQLRPKSTAVATAADNGSDLGAPTHNKYIKYNNDGTYWLSLDVTGASRASTEQKNQPADVVLVMDVSGSMAGDRWRTATSAASTLARKLLTSANAALPTDQQVQMSVVDFSTKSNIVNFGRQQWTTSAQSVIDSFGRMDVTGGTNWEAALEDANTLNTARAGVQKYIVFVSDGTPTFRNSSMNTDCGVAGRDNWDREFTDCDYLKSDGVYGSGISSLPDYKNYNFDAAVNEANQRNGASLYAVSTGSEANEKMQEFANTIDPKGTFFDGTNASKLAAAFDSIVEQITTQSKYQDVLIKDTLSGYAVSTDQNGGTGYLLSASAHDADGNDVSKTDPAATKMHAVYNQQTQQLSLNFDEGTVLSPSVTYTVSIMLKPSDEAYQYFIDHSAQYPSIGEPNTDAEGNDTSSGKPGFFSNADDNDGNTTAQVYYKTVTQQEGQDPVVSPQKQAAYPRPVIQVNVPSLTLVNGVDNTNAGDKYGAKPSYWQLSATKNNGAYGIQSQNPEGKETAEGAVTKQAVATTKLTPGTYTLSETADAASKYQYFGGYAAGTWSCVDAAGKTVKVTTTSGGAQTMNLDQGKDVTCTVINTAKPGSIAWQKVDKNDASKTLSGSEWTLGSTEVSGFADKVVKDNADNDADTTAGALKVTGLKWGDYTLTETKAPSGYAKLTSPVKVTVLPGSATSTDNEFTVGAGEDGKIANTLVAVSALPLTGGTTGRMWLTASGVMLALAGISYAVWRRRMTA